MAELVDWLHHESITRAGTNTASSYIRQDHHLPHGGLEPHITNADRIRSMSDEELGEFLITTSQTDGFCPREQTQCAKHKYSCVTCVIAWLREEANESI